MTPAWGRKEYSFYLGKHWVHGCPVPGARRYTSPGKVPTAGAITDLRSNCKSAALASTTKAWAAIMGRRVCLDYGGQHSLRFCQWLTTYDRDAVWGTARTQFQHQWVNILNWDRAASRVLGYVKTDGQMPLGMPK